MSHSIDLAVLKRHQQALLLAEVAALLHDMGKCADEHIVHQASDKRQEDSYQYKTAQSALLPTHLDVNLLGQAVPVKDLIEQGVPRAISDTSKPWLVRVLGRCHSAAHVEKELSDRDTATKQPRDDTRLSTAFGAEGSPVTGLTELLRSLPFNSLANRTSFVPVVRTAFAHAPGDTRRPVNEVTLADWSDAVAALYKAALAGALLGIKPANPDDLHWRLLRVNFDVLGLYAKAVKIADLLGYQRGVEEACERVKRLVEEEYPLGNEVYRDTTGIYFTFPDLDLPADLAQEIRRLAEEADLELAPRVAVTSGEGATATEQLKGILAKARQEAVQALAQPFDTQNLSVCWQQRWETAGEGNWELCPVCRLRPMKEGDEACDTCLRRRGSRIAEWQGNPHRTIWMDELADANGRVALLVGKFGLDDWLSGDLVQTMLVKAEPNNPAGCIPKNPSPARLRRVWETCQRFWAETAQGILDDLPRRERWLLEVQEKHNLPPEGVVCDGTLNGETISVWRMGDALLTISFLPEKPKEGRLSLTWEYEGRRGQMVYEVKGVAKATDRHSQYHPTLTLLASPDQFLALVPAADALVIADKIRSEYETQFGKVRNRLPLFLGIVFFPHKTPLFAVMEAARRMLGTPLREEAWVIKSDVNNGQVEFQNSIAWNVPTLMGDGKTNDIWYPYWRVEGKPTDCEYYFTGPDGEHWVHVNNLRAGDKVNVTPSRFAYLWLEHTGRRFAFDPAKDALLLDELPRLLGMWHTLKQTGITDTGLRNVQALLEAKASAWGTDGEEFRHLVETTLQEAGLFRRTDKNGNPPSGAVTPEDVIGGRFSRCLELYLHILKEKIKED